MVYKSIYAILVAISLLTAAVCPAETHNTKNISSINMSHLRPMVGNGTKRIHESISSNDELVRKQVLLRIKELKREKNSGLLDRVVENVIALRKKWNEDPDYFLRFNGKEGNRAVSKVLKQMRMDPRSFFGYGDMSKIGAANRAFVRSLVDHFFPIVVNAIDIVAQKYGGFAYRITGDEMGLYLPSKFSPKEIDFIRLEIQATLDNFMDERFGFVKIKGIGIDDIGDIDKANKVLKSDGFSDLYRDKDGVFMVFDRYKFSTGSLEKDCNLAIEEANKKLSSIELQTQSRPQEIPSIRASFGIVRACNKYKKDMYKNFIKSKLHAQYILDMTKKDKNLKMHGATAELLGKKDKFREEMETAIVRLLKKEEIDNLIYEYSEKGIQLSRRHIEGYYPVIKREYLEDVIQRLLAAELDTTVIVRGPPENFYIATKREGYIYLMKAIFYYNPLGDLEEKFKQAIEKEIYTRDDLRESEEWEGWFGFKVIQEFFSHDTGNELVLTEANIINEVFQNSVRLDLSNSGLKKKTDRIVKQVKNQIELPVDVKMILGGLELEIADLGIGSSSKAKQRIARTLDDLEHVAEINEGITVLETKDGNLVKIYSRGKHSEPFWYARYWHREKVRKKFSEILNKTYKKPALSKRDFESITAQSTEIASNHSALDRQDQNEYGWVLIKSTPEKYSAQFSYKMKEQNKDLVLNIGTRQFIIPKETEGVVYENFNNVKKRSHYWMETCVETMGAIIYEEIRRRKDLNIFSIGDFKAEIDCSVEKEIDIINIKLFHNNELIDTISNVIDKELGKISNNRITKLGNFDEIGTDKSYNALVVFSQILAAFKADEALPLRGEISEDRAAFRKVVQDKISRNISSQL